MSSDVFRPRLPKDPFENPYSQPEYIHPDSPWPTYQFSAKSAEFSVQPHVLLVLGAPSAHTLAPVLRSPTFARSLLLLVTHNPPPLSALTHARPTITILRLDGPLLPGAPAFALTLVQVLDAAAAVARAWSGLPHDIQQLAQDPAGAFTVREPLTPDSLPVSHHRPARRTSRLADPPPPSPPNPPLSPVRRPTPNRASSSLSLTKLPVPKRPTPSAASASALRPFDAILSFLPPLQPERAVLKQVVLTTTLAAPFLAGSTRRASASSFDLRSPAYSAYAYGYGYEARPGSIASSESAPRRRSRFSSLFGTGTSTGTRSVPASRPSSASISGFTYTTTNTNTNNTHDEGATAYIIHVLPASYRSAKLEGALGAFVASASVNSTGTRGYVLAERALRDVECLLVGALECAAPNEEGEKGEGEERGRGAWVAGVLNVVTPASAAATVGGEAEVEAEHQEEYGNAKKEKHKNPPFGLPTPPASRHGSREGAGEEEPVSASVAGEREQGQPRQGSGGSGGRRKGSVSLPSSSSHHPQTHHPHLHPHPPQTHPHPASSSATPRPHAPSVALPSSSSPQTHPHPHPTSSSTTPRAHARNPSSSVSGSGGQGKLRRASGRRPPSFAAEGAMRRADSAPVAVPTSAHPSFTPAEVPQTRKSGRRRDNLKLKDKEKDRERGKFFGGKGPGDFSLRAATTLPMSASGERRRWWALWS